MKTETSTQHITPPAAKPLLAACCKCNKDFEPYIWADHCYACDGEGERESEMEWEYEPTIKTCYACKGHGAIKRTEDKMCRDCKKLESMFEDDDWDNEDDEYCDKCGRSCNCR